MTISGYLGSLELEQFLSNNTTLHLSPIITDKPKPQDTDTDTGSRDQQISLLLSVTLT